MNLGILPSSDKRDELMLTEQVAPSDLKTRRDLGWHLIGWRCLGPLVLVGLTSCSGGGPVPTYPVTGTVKLSDGTPLSGGRILLRPDEDSKYAARGDIGEDGSFTLTTFKLGDGATAGTHRIMVTPPIARESLDAAARKTKRPRPMIDPKYESLTKSPLTILVVSDGSSENHFDLVVEPPSSKRRK